MVPPPAPQAWAFETPLLALRAGGTLRCAAYFPSAACAAASRAIGTRNGEQLT